MPQNTPPSPRSLFENLKREHPFEPVSVTGTIPAFLRGTLYRNGVGLFEQFGRRYTHVFEGDGAISAVRVEGDQSLAAVRLVESDGLRAEREAQRHLSGSAARWSTRIRANFTGRSKNNANTHVVSWQDRLFALMEGGKPTEINPDTLETIGESDLEGEIPGAFSAHPHRVESRKALYNFGLRYGKQTQIDLFTLPDTGPARRLGALPLDHPVMVHDFIASDNHLIFFIAPVSISIWRHMVGFGDFADKLKWSPALGTEVIIVPIDRPDQPIRFSVEAFFASHFAGAYEEDGHLVIDYIHYPDISLITVLEDGLGMTWTDKSRHVHGALHRARINIAHRTFTTTPRWDGLCEFPHINPAREGGKYQVIWLQTACYIEDCLRSEISRIDENGGVITYTLPPGQFCSEPVPVMPLHSREDEGSILTLVYDCHDQKSHILILDATDLVEQARIQLSQVIPLTFHGSWVGETPPDPLRD